MGNDQFKNFQIYQKMYSLSLANTSKYTCQFCEYQTLQKRNLTHHEQVVHEGGKFECPECDYQANQKGHLVTHWKSMHMGQKLKCQECDYQATRTGNLHTHLYIWAKSSNVQSAIFSLLRKLT